jgi:hypothetical protein
MSRLQMVVVEIDLITLILLMAEFFRGSTEEIYSSVLSMQ